jgi:hypothetical protein
MGSRGQPARLLYLAIKGTPLVVLRRGVQFLTRKKRRHTVPSMKGSNLQQCRHPDAQATAAGAVSLSFGR